MNEITRQVYEAGRRDALVEAAQALDEKRREYFVQTDRTSQYKASAFHQASGIVRMIRKEGARA